MKLWFDDIRRPPDETWAWARTVEEAQSLVVRARTEGDLVTEASLDHDLGLHNVDPDDYTAMTDDDAHRLWLSVQGLGPTGYRLAEWLIEQSLVPAKVRIHSFNRDGAGAMFRLLESRCECVVRPFEGAR